MKQDILLLNPILIPTINEKLSETYNVRCYYEQDDKDAYIREFGCPIRYTDLHPMADVPYTFVADLKQLASESDALMLAAAADKAEGIINAAVLDALGKKGILVNVARGRLVNEQDLVQALRTGRIAGAGLDVFVDEPLVPTALLGMHNVVLQPHRASATVETRTAMGEMVLTSLAQALAGHRPATSVTT